MMQPDQKIRYFLAVAEAGSFSSAAELLGMSQSGLSRQLKQLENHLGQSVFVRTGRGVELTDAGKRLYVATRAAFDSIDKTVNLIRSEYGIIQGSIRIAIVHTLNHYFMPKLLTLFLNGYSAVNCFVLGRSSPDVVDFVRTGKADIGFVYDVAVTADDLVIEHLFEETMSLIAHQDDQRRFLLTHPPAPAPPLITFPENYALRQMLHRARLDTNVVAEVDTIDAMLRLVSCKLGVCVLPSRIPASEIKELQLSSIPLHNPALRRRVVCIYRQSVVPSAICAALLAMAKDLSASI